MLNYGIVICIFSHKATQLVDCYLQAFSKTTGDYYCTVLKLYKQDEYVNAHLFTIFLTIYTRDTIFLSRYTSGIKCVLPQLLHVIII